MPSTLTSVPKLQPIRSLLGIVRPNMIPASAGTIRYENNRSTPATARQREHERPEERGGEAERVRLPRVGLPAQEKRRGGPERRDLSEGDVHEDDLAREDVDAQVRVDAREHQAHQERRPQDREEIADHAT